ncbi:MAG: alpha/beta hydrolase [Anaerolineae bacterium]|nr:alpha/beta hydrolase [Anaerolineae bacterium]MDQ7034852.1 alpha/beta hydrolase [Anaerolineae bacterium]
MINIPTSIITIDNININQAIAGEGQPVLLLHGWGVNITLVWTLAESLIRHGYRCYAVDMPGFGDTDDPPQAWTVFDYANFVINYLDYHNLEQVYLFGHSFGGRLGLILGAEYSQRIIKMALSDSAGIREETPLLPRLRLNTYKAIRDTMNTIGLKSFAENLRHQYNKRYASSDFQAVSGVMRQTFVNVVNQDLLDYAARVKVSTILFWGDKDQGTPLWMGQKLEQTIPDAGLVVHQGAGHYAYLDNLADTVRVMDYFFKQEAS